MEYCDVLVIGGGLLGCFAARNLTRYNLSVALAEIREDICTGISRANTAIIYSGADTKPQTLKTSMCVRAAQGFETLCSELGVRYSKCGSIMVCFGPDGERVLRKKMEQSVENGVRGARLMNRSEVLEREPNLRPEVVSGLFVPDTGTVMPWELCFAAAENAIKNGARIFLNTEITDIEKNEHGYTARSERLSVRARCVINCAGLGADGLLEKLSEPSVRVFPSCADYYVLDAKAKGFIRHVIFHEPEGRKKGLTLVPMLEGNILVGPSEISEGRGVFETTKEGLAELERLVGEVTPCLPMDQIIRSFGSVRPNPYWVEKGSGGEYIKSGRGINDFVIVSSDKLPGFFSLVGIKTPGLTCADELGRHLAGKAANFLKAGKNSGFDPKRPAPVRLRGLPFNERLALVKQNPAYGNIVCRCQEISEGEILDGIRRVPGAVTLDGVKRRAGAGMGRCQGSFCMPRVIEILSRELSIAPYEITKDGKGSFMILGGGDEGL